MVHGSWHMRGLNAMTTRTPICQLKGHYLINRWTSAENKREKPNCGALKTCKKTPFCKPTSNMCEKWLINDCWNLVKHSCGYDQSEKMSENGQKETKNGLNTLFTISFSLFTMDLTNFGETWAYPHAQTSRHIPILTLPGNPTSQLSQFCLFRFIF